MLTRIVKMTFKEDKIDDFVERFKNVQARIAGFEGCHKVELYRDQRNPNVFFTLSLWESEDRLEAYRHSELFQNTWKYTKTLFDDKPQAWSLGKAQLD